MTDGYEAWWNVGIATTSVKQSVKNACEKSDGRQKRSKKNIEKGAKNESVWLSKI